MTCLLRLGASLDDRWGGRQRSSQGRALSQNNEHSARAYPSEGQGRPLHQSISVTQEQWWWSCVCQGGCRSQCSLVVRMASEFLKKEHPIVPAPSSGRSSLCLPCGRGQRLGRSVAGPHLWHWWPQVFTAACTEVAIRKCFTH